MVSATLDTPAREVAERRGIRRARPAVDPSAPAASSRSTACRSARCRRRARARRRRAAAAHVGHDVAAEARAADAREPGRVGAQRRRDARLDADGPLPERDAAVPHPRPRRRAARLAARGRLRRLHARASTSCTFFDWLDELEPTWYTAVPTMHQAVLARAATQPESVERHRLRFIRSSSAALPPRRRSGARGDLRRAGDRGLRHDRGRAPDGDATRCRPACASPARSAWPPGPRSPIIDAAGELLRAGRDRRGRDPRRRTSSPATRRTRRRTRAPSSTAGSAPATRASSTTTAT